MMETRGGKYEKVNGAVGPGINAADDIEKKTQTQEQGVSDLERRCWRTAVRPSEWHRPPPKKGAGVINSLLC